MRTFNNIIVKETEKAILVKCQVCWNQAASHVKELWMPKSVVKANEDVIEMPYWFGEKIAKNNSFNGYWMEFCNVVPE